VSHTETAENGRGEVTFGLRLERPFYVLLGEPVALATSGSGVSKKVFVSHRDAENAEKKKGIR